MTDYITKWVEVEPLSNIRDVDGKISCGRILSPDLGSPIHSSWTTDSNLIVRLSGDTVVSKASEIDIQTQPSHRRMGRPKLLIRS